MNKHKFVKSFKSYNQQWESFEYSHMQGLAAMDCQELADGQNHDENQFSQAGTVIADVVERCQRHCVQAKTRLCVIHLKLLN